MSAGAGAQYSIRDAQANLPQIIERVEHGEEVIISRAGRPVAKVIALTATAQRLGRGSLRGRLVLADNWDSDEVIEASRMTSA